VLLDLLGEGFETEIRADRRALVVGCELRQDAAVLQDHAVRRGRLDARGLRDRRARRDSRLPLARGAATSHAEAHDHPNASRGRSPHRSAAIGAKTGS
jgi:hypothetical protein